MSASSRVYFFPLTARWYIAWRRSKQRLRVKVIHTRVDGRDEVIAITETFLGYAVTLGVFAGPPSATRVWFRDFGHWFGRYTVGGWRTVRPVPVSTGWAFNGSNGARIGCTVTVASRTLMFAKLATRAEGRASRERHGDLHRKAAR